MMTSAPLPSTQLSQELVAHSPIGLAVLVPVHQASAAREGSDLLTDFTFQFINPAGAALLGQSAAHLIGQRCKAFFSTSGDFLFRVLEQAWQTGQPRHLPQVAYTVNGQREWLDLHLTRHQNTLQATFSDVSALKQIALQAQRQQTFLDQIFNVSQEAIYVLEAVREPGPSSAIIDFRYRQVNKAFERLFHVKTAHIIGQSILSLYPTIETNGLFGSFCQVVETGEPLHQEIFYDGENLRGWYALTVVKMEDGVMGTTRDITAEKQAVQQDRQQLLTLVDNSNEFMAITDQQEQLQYLNQAGRTLVGLPPDADLAALKVADFYFPDGYHQLTSHILPRLSQQGRWEGPLTIRHFRTGEPIPCQASFIRIQDPTTGQSIGRGVSLRDLRDELTTRRTLEEQATQQRFLLSLSDRLRPLADPVAIQYEAVCTLGQHLGACRVGYAEDQEDEDTIVVTRNYTQGVPGLEGRYRYEDYGATLMRDLKAGITVVRNDIANDPSLTDAQKASHAVLQLGATVNKPLVKAGKLVAVLFVHFSDAHTWTTEELTLLDETAERTWAAVERARAVEALRESEQRFRLMADTVPQSIWITDAQGQVEFLNKQWCDYCGVSFWPETASQVAVDFVHPDDVPHLMATFSESLQTGRPFEVEQRNRSASGEYRWFLNRAAPYHDPRTGKIQKWFGVGIDIHDRKLAEKALHESEERFRLFVTTSSDSVYRMSADWSHLVNLIGKSFIATTDEPTQSWLMKYIPEVDQAQVMQAIQEAIRAKRIFELEHRVFRVDGSIGWTFSRAIPVLNQQGDIVEWFGTASDVTERKRAEEALRKSEQRYRTLSAQLEEQVRQRTAELETSILDLQRSNDNLQQFAFVASHDLQEPLRKIQQFCMLLEEQLPALSGPASDYLNRMQTAASRMSVLIRDLLTYSRISTQQNESSWVSLPRVINRVFNDLELIIAETRARIEVGPLPTIRGDATQLGQLFLNLVSNALKFQAPNSPPHLVIRSHQLPESEIPASVRPARQAAFYHHIEITDNGIGFDEKYLDRIFQVFQRLHGRQHYAGTGIGLAICARVAANHGGAITARSQPGSGATFSVFLPVSQVPDEAAKA